MHRPAAPDPDLAGVDARRFPWGEVFDASWCCTTDSFAGQRMPVVVESFPVDESPYGVRGLAGNARDWCMDLAPPRRPALEGGRVLPPDRAADASARSLRIVRGGGWDSSERSSRCASRVRLEGVNPYSILGVRGVYRPV